MARKRFRSGPSCPRYHQQMPLRNLPVGPRTSQDKTLPWGTSWLADFLSHVRTAPPDPRAVKQHDGNWPPPRSSILRRRSRLRLRIPGPVSDPRTHGDEPRARNRHRRWGRGYPATSRTLRPSRREKSATGRLWQFSASWGPSRGPGTTKKTTQHEKPVQPVQGIRKSALRNPGADFLGELRFL